MRRAVLRDPVQQAKKIRAAEKGLQRASVQSKDTKTSEVSEEMEDC